MLDKTCIKFLKYLLMMERIKKYELFNYFSMANKIEYEVAYNYCQYLLKERYIKYKNQFIVPTFKTRVFFKHNEESKLKQIFVVWFLPYIQQFVIFILGLLAPYLIEMLKHILKSLIS